MLLNDFKYGFLLALAFFLSVSCIAQGVGRAIYNVDFGEGTANTGPVPAAGKTGFQYTADSCPVPGYYTITNSLYKCPGSRIGRSLDHTFQSSGGYMMLANGLPGVTGKLLYVDTLREALCPGTNYQFSAWILNTTIPATCNSGNVRFPSFTFSVETIGGQVLEATHTGPMGYDYDMVFTPKFHFCKVDFVMPPGENALILKINNEASGLPSCPYSFAVDDIQFTSTGPESKIEFDGAVGIELVKSVCFQDQKRITLNGSVGAFYANTSLQWQQSNNNGVTWTDISGATAGNYTGTFSIADSFLFRLSAGEAVNMVNPNCRVVSNVLTVQVDGMPSSFNTTSNSPVCVGSDLIFDAEGGASYEWYGPNNFYDNISYPHIFYSSLADSGWYYVDVITLGGCRGRDSIYATVIGTDVQAGPDTAICMGSMVQLRSSTGLHYSWSPPNGLSDISESSPAAKPTVTTEYTVKVTDSNGCSDTAKLQVKVINDVEVKARIDGAVFLCRPYDSASFNNRSAGNITKWKWNFGNGYTSDSAVAPNQYFSIPANRDGYTISLAIADSSGCTDTAYLRLKAVSNCYIAVPSAFTPNNDGLNDYLYPLNAYKAANLLFMVFNRKGILLFETKDWTNKWNGNFNGEPQDPGSYVWILQYDNELGKKILLKGSTVLLR